MGLIIPSQTDVEHLQAIRDNVRAFMSHCSQTYALKPGRLLDIAPQDHEGARPFFSSQIAVETFDIDPAAGSDYVGDITLHNAFFEDESFEYIVCTEVLEHVLQPFDAAKELYRLIRPNGLVFISVPFNFRIHGPLPDCWRFTEHGLRALLSAFNLLELNSLETPERPLMPIHYTVVAQKQGR
jgi:hypothetical protein